MNCLNESIKILAAFVVAWSHPLPALISVIFSWVVLVFGSSFLGINMHYFVIHTSISTIMLGFRLYMF